ncbi:MAG: hypothetical protein IT423_19515 [Pirellulaceae bacterium]|nr:hypothetical protein [Pirellulaceae bacterium]
MLLLGLKRRWPLLTTAVAALLWLVNNYDIRGLDGVRLEPRPTTTSPDPLGYGAPMGWPTSYPSGPALPGTNTQPLWPTSNYSQYPSVNEPTNHPSAVAVPGVGYSAGYPSAASGLPALPGTTPIAAPGVVPHGLPSTSPAARPGLQLPGGLALPRYLSVDDLRLPPAVSALAGDDWNRLLSVGEKLGMLEKSRQPAPTIPVMHQPLAGYSPPSGVPTSAPLPAVLPNLSTPRDTIRIASFNLNGWGDKSRDNPASTEMIVRLIGQFDLIALQDIRSRRDDLLPNLMVQLNSTGRNFDFMIGPRVGRGELREQLAFIFDTERVETDRFQLYTVADPEDMLVREPLVGWFRAKQADSREAFTFSLVNVHIDSDLAATELQAIPNLVDAIYSDGRGEDDVILAGDFSAAAPQAAFFSAGNFRTVIEGMATNTRGTHLLDNFGMPVANTSEFTGRAGAVDFLRQYNLSLEQAVSVSEHLPIWAEFSIIEGGRPGQVAGNALPEHRFHSGVN